MEIDKKFKGKPCIYKITNLVDGKIYVGKAKCLVSRTYNYNSSFRQERHDHINDYMFYAMQKHGFENFKIEPIEFCGLDQLAERELFWILELKSNIRERGYNLRLDSSTGMITSAETSARISVNLQTQWESGIRDGHGEKLKLMMANFSPEKKKSISNQLVKIKTKYLYIVIDKDGNENDYVYQELKELKLHNALSTMYKHGIDEVWHKGLKVKRVIF